MSLNNVIHRGAFLCLSSVVFVTIALSPLPMVAEALPTCLQCPICSARPWMTVFFPPDTACWFANEPDFTKPKHIATAGACLERALLHETVGHEEVMKDVRNAVLNKLMHPNQPFVMHLAGDNGVGKTHTVRQISRATSLRLHQSDVTAPGENLLLIQGTSYNGLELPIARRSIVQAVVAHLKKYPHGIILIDDIRQLSIDVLRAMAPLFGRGNGFPEDPSVDVRKAMVFLTSDFGKEARTRGLLREQVAALVHQELKEKWGADSLIHTVRVLAMLPFDASMTKAQLTLAIDTLPCRLSRIRAVDAERGIIEVLQQQLMTTGSLHARNGRAVVELVQTQLDEKVSLYRASTAGLDTELDVSVRMRDDGSIYVRVVPVDGASLPAEL